VLKRRFCILLLAPEYDLDIQARIPVALCTIHNFIREHDPDEGELFAQEISGDHDKVDDADVAYYAAEDVEDGETDMAATWDQIATEMWEAYMSLQNTVDGEEDEEHSTEGEDA
jgi:hypothetical protein